jgi:AcrR family transcriptional regulator
VSKGGFYWHFTDRQALLDEMFDTWETAPGLTRHGSDLTYLDCKRVRTPATMSS